MCYLIQRYKPVIPCTLKASISHVFKCTQACQARMHAHTHTVFMLLHSPGQFSLCYLACRSQSYISPAQINGFHSFVEYCVFKSSLPSDNHMGNDALSLSCSMEKIPKTQVLDPAKSHVTLNMRQRRTVMSHRREKDTE